MKVQFELSAPFMPNFARFIDNDRVSVDIADFTEEEAMEYAELMKQTFLEHYKNRKSRKQSLTELTQ